MLLVGVGAAGRRRLPSGRGRPGPALRRPRPRSPPRSRPSSPTIGLEPFVVGRHAGLVRLLAGARTAPEHVPGRPDRARRPRRRRPAGRLDAGRRDRRRRLAVPDCWPACPPTSRTRRGWPTRPSTRPRPPGSRSRSGREAARRRGFGGIVGVGQASAAPPRLVRLDYTPAQGGRAARRHVVLVGKGITFDTGGLSIKPGEAMVNMKRDMTGGAVVIAGDGRAGRRRLPGQGRRPAAGGRERRRRQRDAPRRRGHATTAAAPPRSPTPTPRAGWCWPTRLAYAVDKLDPDVLVDVATLTGAIKVALGQQVGGLFANDDALADALLDAPGPRRRAAVADAAAPRSTRTSSSSQVADADNARGGPRRDHGRAVPPALRRRRARGRTSTSPRPATPPTTASSGPRARPGSGPGCCSTGSAATTRWPASARRS